MLSVEKKITKSVSFQFINLLVNGLAGVFFIPFIIQSLGKDQYGLFEIAFSLNLINNVLDIGIGSTITNYAKKYFDLKLDKYYDFYWTYFWFKVALSFIGFALCLLIYLNVKIIFTKVSIDNLPVLGDLILWFGIGVLIQNLNSFLDALVNGFIRFDISSIANIVSKALYVIIFLIWFYLDRITIVQFSILTFVLIPSIKLLAQLLQVKVYMPEILSKPRGPKILYIRESLNYLGGISFVTILAQIFTLGTQAILAVIASPVIVGEFGVLQRIIRLIRQVSDMIVRPILPAANDLREKYSIEKIINTGTNIHSIVVTGLTFIVMVNAGFISMYYLNDEYPNFSTHLIILSSMLIVPSFAVMLMLYYNEGKSKMSVQFNFTNTILSITLAIVGFKVYNFIGFISGLTIGYTIISLVQIIRFLNYYKISFIKFMKIYFMRYFTIVIGVLMALVIQSNIDRVIIKFIVLNASLMTLIFAFAWYGLGNDIRTGILNYRKNK